MLITREDSRQGRLMAERQANMDALAYAGYLGRVDAILDCRGSRLQSQDLPYNWQADFMAGVEPSQSVDDALAGVVVYADPWTAAKARGQARLEKRRAI